MVRWPDLTVEFDRWHEAGEVATLWWRDDDAVAPTDRLDRVLSIAPGVPISLAVIPAVAERELGEWLRRGKRHASRADIAVLQHGWLHLNHSGVRKKSEFPRDRPSTDISFDLCAGRARLSELFGAQALPVLVPPWNRFDDCFLELLYGCGLNGISRSLPRRARRPAPAIIEANVHIDLVAWKAGRGFIGEEAALGGLLGHLRSRRAGTMSTDEPTGILTHHLIQDRATDDFLARLIAQSFAHPAVCWLSAAEIFVPSARVSA
jgi:hypothetical protein